MAPSVRRGGSALLAASATATDSDQPRNTPSYYLLKSEPHEFSIDQLEQCPDMTSEWDGIRNYQARNILRTMQVDDLAWFYHSSCKEPGIVGKVRITRTVQPDATALQPNHKYYDAKSTPESCRWDSVQIRLDHKYPVQLNLSELRAQAAAAKTETSDDTDGDDTKSKAIAGIIAGMKLLQTTRLSVQPVTPEEWRAVEELIAKKEKGEALLATSADDNSKEITTGKKKAKRATKRAPTKAADDDADNIEVETTEKSKKPTTKVTQGTRKSKRTKSKE